MVETIAPVVHGGRNHSYRRAVALHVVGTTVSAAALGAWLGAMGLAAGAPWGAGGLGALACIALLYALREVANLPLPLFDRRRQVPEWWRTFFSKPTAALLYGLGLGAGFFTYLSYGTFVVVSAAAFLTGDPRLGALLGAPFGLARGLSVLVGRRGPTGDTLAELERWADGSAVRLANASALALLGVTAAVARF